MESIDLRGIQIVSSDPLKHIHNAAKVECVMKNGQFDSVATVMAPFAKSTIGAAMPTLLPNCDGSSAIRGQQLAGNLNHFCLQKLLGSVP
jgi:hypothetical protein